MPAKRRFTFEVWWKLTSHRIVRPKKSRRRWRYTSRQEGFFSSQRLARKAGREFGKELTIHEFNEFEAKVGLKEGYTLIPRLVAILPGEKRGRVLTLENEVIQLTA